MSVQYGGALTNLDSLAREQMFVGSHRLLMVAPDSFDDATNLP